MTREKMKTRRSRLVEENDKRGKEIFKKVFKKKKMREKGGVKR